MPITGKDVLGALGIDETFVSDMEKPATIRAVELAKERVLLSLIQNARLRSQTITEAPVARHDLRALVTDVQTWSARSSYDVLPGEIGNEIRTGIHNVCLAIEALIPHADKA